MRKIDADVSAQPIRGGWVRITLKTPLGAISFVDLDAEAAARLCEQLAAKAEG